MAIAGIVLGAAALVVMLLVEWLKRPRLEIAPARWQAAGPVPWTFAAVEVKNRPLFPLLRSFLVRDSAQSCEVTLEFREPGKRQLAIPSVPARWSAQPEPLRSVPVQGPSGTTFAVQYDPSLVPQSLRLDVPAGDTGREIGVAVLRSDGTAHAWGAQSYAYVDWKNPDWVLQRQVYEVTVIARASGVTARHRFTLDNLAANFATFSTLK